MNIKQLPAEEIARIGEIDRSEHVTTGYRYRDGELKAESVDWQVPRWPNDDSAHGIITHIKAWKPYLDQNGVLLGAFEDSTLVGFAIFRPNLTDSLTDSMAQLAVLHISRDFRRKGIARALTEQVVQLARKSGAKSLYVSATPSESAVGFYRSQGFELVDDPHPELYALEPDDIHMIKTL